jgi:hypothetical protein
MPPPRVQAKFIAPMLLLRTEKLPEGDGSSYELKLDGFRAIAFKSAGMRSRATALPAGWNAPNSVEHGEEGVHAADRLRLFADAENGVARRVRHIVPNVNLICGQRRSRTRQQISCPDSLAYPCPGAD